MALVWCDAESLWRTRAERIGAAFNAKRLSIMRVEESPFFGLNGYIEVVGQKTQCIFVVRPQKRWEWDWSIFQIEISGRYFGNIVISENRKFGIEAWQEPLRATLAQAAFCWGYSADEVNEYLGITLSAHQQLPLLQRMRDFDARL